MKKGIVVLLGCLMGLTGESLYAFDWYGGRLSIGGGYGRVRPVLPDSFKDAYEDGEAWSGHIKYWLNNDFSLVASYADLGPSAEGNRLDFYRFRPIVGSFRYNIFHHLPFSPYLTAGFGYSRNKHEAPNTPTDKWSSWTYQAGLGFEFFITESTALGAEALYHHFNGHNGAHPYRLASLLGTANIYFGSGPSAKRHKQDAERQKAEAERQKAEADRATAEANAAKDAAIAAQASAAQSQKDMQAMQAQTAAAQAEIEAIKQMIARKDIQPITFKTGSAELETSSNDTLTRVAEAIKKYPNLKVRVEGHTDNVGSDNLNQQLSQRRAQSVKDHLVQTGGVPESQVTAIGVGEGNPVADNKTAEGRAQNRRVEFITYIP